MPLASSAEFPLSEYLKLADLRAVPGSPTAPAVAAYQQLLKSPPSYASPVRVTPPKPMLDANPAIAQAAQMAAQSNAAIQRQKEHALIGQTAARGAPALQLDRGATAALPAPSRLGRVSSGIGRAISDVMGRFGLGRKPGVGMAA